MSRFIAQDSIGRNTEYADLFNPNAAHQAALKKARAKAYLDTMESSGKLLEGEILLKLEKEEGSPRNQALIAGKYLLMTVLFPFYFTFWGMPKWSVQKGGPSLRRIAKKWNQLVSHLSKQLVSPFQWLTKSILQQVKAAQAEIKQLLARIKERTAQSIKKAAQPLHMGFGQALGALQRAQGAMNRWAQKTAKSFQNSFLALNHLQKRLTQHLIVQWNAASDDVSYQMEKMFLWTKPFLQKVQGTYLNPAKAFATAFKNHVLTYVKKASQGVAKAPFLRLPKGTKKWIQERTRPLFDLIGEQAEKIAKKAKEGADFGKKIAEPLTQLLQPLSQPVINFFASFVSFRKKEGVSRKKGSYKARVQAVRNRMGRAKQATRRFFKKAKAVTLQLIEKGHSLFLVAMKWLLLLAKRLFYALIALLKRIFIVLYILSIWSRVLIRYGARLVKRQVGQALGLNS